MSSQVVFRKAIQPVFHSLPLEHDRGVPRVLLHITAQVFFVAASFLTRPMDAINSPAMLSLRALTIKSFMDGAAMDAKIATIEMVINSSMSVKPVFFLVIFFEKIEKINELKRVYLNP